MLFKFNLQLNVFCFLQVSINIAAGYRELGLDALIMYQVNFVTVRFDVCDRSIPLIIDRGN